MTEGPGQRPVRAGSPGPGPGPLLEPGRGRGLDRAIGILLGILLGIATVTAFVFLGSEDTIDAPRISNEGATGSGGSAGAATAQAPRAQPQPAGRKAGAGAADLPVVRVIGGAPPESGPPRLDFKLGGRVRFRIRTDAPVAIEIPGYGISDTVGSNAIVSFRATRPGQFPVIASASHIGIASLQIER